MEADQRNGKKFGGKVQGLVALSGMICLAILSSIPAIRALTGESYRHAIDLSLAFGPIPVSVDPLSAWFILIINFTFLTSAIYGISYLSSYNTTSAARSLHWTSFFLTHAGILAVCVVQHAVGFLVAWEIMALGTFVLVIFDGSHPRTLKAGLNYLIQSHVAVLLLTVAFLWVAVRQGSFDFQAISAFAEAFPGESLVLMGLFFAGFGIKAGFIPFHTWLPHAHPAAPTHVSAMMSGVLIKIGIFGILRMLLLIQVNYLVTGYFILTLSIITGIYGVMLALVQHDLKRLLAYHSIENIGIIGMGIGMGCIGLGTGNALLSSLGFAGALLHTLNHSLFKSLLFFGAGNIYRVSGSMNLEHFGGLVKRMPQTTFLFLLSALAICGLPPFNGFISEFILYSGMFNAMPGTGFPAVLFFLFAVFGLSLIGGLAIFCFTKAFGILFLGTPRTGICAHAEDPDRTALVPMYLTGALIVAIGLFPRGFLHALLLPVGQLSGVSAVVQGPVIGSSLETAGHIGLYSLGLIALAGLLYIVRQRLISRLPSATSPTWGCGYEPSGPRLQYTASSFVRNYRKLAEPLLSMRKEKRDVEGIFPGNAIHATHPEDGMERILIRWPLQKLRAFMGLFSFLQNGRLQFYILYGMLFILVILAAPLVFYILRSILHFFNTF